MNEELLEKLPEEFRMLFSSLWNQNQLLQEEVTRLRRALYGSHSEKHVKGVFIEPQGTLFDEIEFELCGPLKPDEDSQLEKPSENGAKKRNRSPDSGGRKPLPADIPRERIVHDLEESAQNCPADGSKLSCIGEDVVEKLEFVPATLKVIQHVYPKYGCTVCKGCIERAQTLPAVLPHAQCGPGLLAQIIICKYLLALPLYRQESDFAEMGIELSRTSMARWVVSAHSFLVPLLGLMKKFIISRPAIHADETAVQVLKEEGKTPQSKSYMWTMCSAESDHTAVWFEYHSSRAAESAKALLGDYSGLLHADGYAGYDSICKRDKVTRIGCWAHVRRKFDVAKKDGAKSGRGLAVEYLDLIQKLFQIERDLASLPANQKIEGRIQHSKPIVEAIKELQNRHLSRVAPKSKLGLAMIYLQNCWPELNVFLEHHNASLSNNRLENFIRPFVTGRKNWLFADTVGGAEASAGLYSLLITARANGLQARPYLISLFTELPILLSQTPDANLEVYLPWNWKSNPAAVPIGTSEPAEYEVDPAQFAPDALN